MAAGLIVFLLFFLPGLVRLYGEYSHHRWEGDPFALQRHHQAGHSEETARGRATLSKGPHPAGRLDCRVQSPLPRQNRSADETYPQTAPAVLLEPLGRSASSNTSNTRATASELHAAGVPDHTHMQKAHSPFQKVPFTPALSPALCRPAWRSSPVGFASQALG